jgi:hypothetical protein
VLLRIGTNDVLQHRDLANAPNRLFADRPHHRCLSVHGGFVATTIPLASTGQETAARTFNAAIPDMVRVTSRRQITCT